MAERRRRKKTREQDITGRFLAGDFDEDHADKQQRFSARSKGAEQDKILKTAAMRATGDVAADVDGLPVGEVIQIHSLFCEVEHEGLTFLCTARKTLYKLNKTGIVVGDSIWDVLAATRCRALGVGLLSGGYGPDELRQAGAIRVYEDPADLLNHIDEVGGRR